MKLSELLIFQTKSIFKVSLLEESSYLLNKNLFLKKLKLRH